MSAPLLDLEKSQCTEISAQICFIRQLIFTTLISCSAFSWHLKWLSLYLCCLSPPVSVRVYISFGKSTKNITKISTSVPLSAVSNSILSQPLFSETKKLFPESPPSHVHLRPLLHLSFHVPLRHDVSPHNKPICSMWWVFSSPYCSQLKQTDWSSIWFS